MSIVNRIWSLEAAPADPLSQRLNDLVGKDMPGVAESDTRDSASPEQAPLSSAAPSVKAATATAEMEPEVVGEPAQDHPSLENQKNAPPDAAKGFFEPMDWDRDRQEKPMENRSTKLAEDSKPEPVRQENTSPSPDPMGPGQQFMERLRTAVGRTETAGEKSPAATGQAPPEFQAIQKQFEADFRKRLDGALAEFERRVSSQALVDDVAGQIEQRIRLVADGIFKEVKGQAWMMHTAVAGELRSFRDQFSKEIEERVGMLDRAAQHAVQLKEKLEETMPKAEDTLRSLSASGQEASAKFQEASKVFADQLRLSHEELSRDVDARREALQDLTQNLRQEGQQLNEQMEKFRNEAAAACDVLGRASDLSLEKLNAVADEANTRAREGLEHTAGEIERRILSSDLVEKATERLGKATQEMVDPSLDRIRQASQDADSRAESLSATGGRVAEQLEAARQQIEARLDSLLGEQLNLLEGTMSGFQRKASEELGGLVERVVAESTNQLDGRLHGLLQDLFTSTSKQINTVARATLTDMHDGLKEAFKPQDAAPAANPDPVSVSND